MTLSGAFPPPEALHALSRSLGGIWAVLMRGVGLWAIRERATPLPMLTVRRAGTLVARLQALLALLAAGRLPRAYPPRTGAAPARAPEPQPANAMAEASPIPPPRPRSAGLPRRVGWLMGQHVEINVAANHLRLWLADPAVQAVLAEIPQARRPVAVLCRALAIPPWPLPPLGPLPPPTPRVRKPPPSEKGPRKPRRPTLAEDRAAVWHHRCYETDTGFVRPGRRPWWMPPRGRRR